MERQVVKLPSEAASHTDADLSPNAPFPIQFSAKAPGKAVENDPGGWMLKSKWGNPRDASASWLPSGLAQPWSLCLSGE